MTALLLLFAAAAPPAPTAFVARVRTHFTAWDADRDGVLSADEIERAVHDPKVSGDAAAAAAALRRAVRGAGLRSLTTRQIADGRYEPMYAAARERIRTANRELFASETPKVESLGQGRLGDCFLLATLGTLAANDPARLKKMFREFPGGKVEVTLAARKLVLDRPTDGEICIGAQNRNDGMWAIAFEKAVGTVYLERQTVRRHHTPLSIIGVGGSPHLPLEIVTGHRVVRAGCEDFQGGTLDAASRAKRLADLRKQLSDARRAGRLIVGGTAPLGGRQAVVPGLYYNHSYGVLNYDEKTDLVTFWNPFGNRFIPKGEPGLKNGYVTSYGKFTMPLPDAVMWFGSFSIETGEPAGR